MCKYGSEFTVSLNKTGPIKPWQPQQLLSLHDCFFCGSPQEVPSLKTSCSVCSRSHPNVNRPCQKTMGWKEFNLFLLPRLHTEVNVVRKCMHHKFCVQLFSNLCEVYFALSVETFHSHELPSLLVCQGCAGSPLKSASTASGESTVGGHGCSSSFTLPSSSNFLTKRSIVFLAGAQRVWKIVQNHLCFAVYRFVLTNKTTSALCSTVKWQWRAVLQNCLYLGGCTGLWDFMTFSGISRKYSRLLCILNSAAWLFIFYLFYKCINCSCATM